MIKKIVIMLFLVLVARSSDCQWTSSYWGNYGGDNNISSAKGLAVAVDYYGNCYVTGYSSSESEAENLILIKYNIQGDTVWTRVYNGPANLDDRGIAVKTDYYGYVYVCGTSKTSAVSRDIVIQKYDFNGTLTWTKTYNGPENLDDVSMDMTSDWYGNVYVTGCSIVEGKYDMLLIKYDYFGAQAWVRTFGEDNFDEKAFGIVSDFSGNVFITGYCETEQELQNILTVKYNSSGNHVWTRTYDASDKNDCANDIAIDYFGNVYVAGYVTTDSNGTDCVVLKYNTSSIQEWVSTFNGTGNSEDKAFGIVVDYIGSSIYTTGFTTGNTSSADYLTIKYNGYGAQQWVATYNGTGNGDDKANALALLWNQTLIVTGQSWGTSDTHDYATIRYQGTDGYMLQLSRYSLTGTSEDVAKGVAASYSNNVYVTGFSELLIEGTSSPSAITTTMLNWGEKMDISASNNSPRNFKLYQNYPNPFNPSTTIKFELPVTARVKLAVYDMLGREVATLVNDVMKAGTYDVKFSNPGLASGIYFYQLTADGFKDVKKLSVIK